MKTNTGFSKAMSKVQKQAAREMEKERPAHVTSQFERTTHVDLDFERYLSLLSIARSGGFAGLPEIQGPDAGMFQRFFNLVRDSQIALNTFRVFKVDDLAPGTVESSSFLGFYEGMGEDQMLFALDVHLSNPVCIFFLSALLTVMNQAASVVVTACREARSKDIHESTIRDLSFWYDKERSRCFAEFRDLVARFEEDKVVSE